MKENQLSFNRKNLDEKFVAHVVNHSIAKLIIIISSQYWLDNDLDFWD